VNDQSLRCTCRFALDEPSRLMLIFAHCFWHAHNSRPQPCTCQVGQVLYSTRLGELAQTHTCCSTVAPPGTLFKHFKLNSKVCCYLHPMNGHLPIELHAQL
jgi:hypothetical protein